MAIKADSPGVIAPPPPIALAAMVIGLTLSWLWPTGVVASVVAF
jgi:hypothetical protein